MVRTGNIFQQMSEGWTVNETVHPSSYNSSDSVPETGSPRGVGLTKSTSTFHLLPSKYCFVCVFLEKKYVGKSKTLNYIFKKTLLLENLLVKY